MSKCYRCNSPIPPNGALRCNTCYNKTSSFITAAIPPATDAFGKPIKTFSYNTQRKTAREEYLGTVAEIQESKHINSLYKQRTGDILLIIFVFAFWILLSDELKYLGSVPSTLIGIAVVAFAILRLTWIFLKWRGKLGNVTKSKLRENDIHYVQSYYYYNNNVIGYAKYVRSIKINNNRIPHYAVYELNKNNIKGIYYDEKYAEFVLVLHRPVYSDFDLPPKAEFRIPDVFDDATISQALGCDLPPRNTPF